jgi:NhaP-type Na+/H+ or K+/H+ antiporter
VLKISLIDVLLLASGVLAVVVIALSRILRRLPVSEPLVALAAGVLLGPQVLGALEVAPLTQEWEHLHTASRLLLALSVMAVALRYPAGPLRRHWRPVAVLLIVVMPLMALAAAALSAAVLGLGLGAALLLGAALAPTDPVLASSVVTGRPAETTLPERDRVVLSVESGANDGLAFPLVLAALAVAAPVTASAAATEAVYAVAGAVVLGAASGWLGARALAWAESHHQAERTPTLLFTALLALGVLGASGLLGLNGLLGAFVAGVAFNLASSGDDRARDAGIDESVNRVLALPLFLYLGAVLPWQDWAALGWQGVALALAVLLLRRLPLLLLLARPLRFGLPDAVYLGWFGPIGVSSVFYLTLIAERGAAAPGLLAAGTLVVVTSVVVHGTTAAPGVALYRRVAGRR